MDADRVRQLYPVTGEHPLEGLYLNHDLRAEGERLGRAFVYTNYVTSLDGRIAIPRSDGKGMTVPKDTANDRDWRLFQELATQADVIITSGRYLRDYAEGKAQEILRAHDDPRFADLLRWRIERGLGPQPDLAVISGSLDFPIPETLIQAKRRVTVFTHAASDTGRRAGLEAQMGTVRIVGEDDVEGEALITGLSELGYRTVYMATGPKVNHILVSSDTLDRLYLTVVPRLLGGDPFSSIVEGALLQPPVSLSLATLYHDPAALDGLGQLFMSFNR
jgi:riboflavin biosynthesis pyrimidine reductase